MRTFSLLACALGIVLAVALLIGGRTYGALIGLPVFLSGIVGYMRGQGTEAYERRESARNTEMAKTSAISRWRGNR